MNPNDIISFLISPNFSGGLLAVKIILLVFSLLFLIFINIILFKTTWLKRILLWDLSEIFTYRAHGIGKFTKRWKKIQDRIKIGLESELKLAIIEADALLDDVLMEMGYSGESLGDRLEKLTTDLIPNISEVITAHALRNNIIHDPSYRLDLEEAKKCLEVYEKTLIFLQVL